MMKGVFIYINASYIYLHQETYLYHAVTYVCLYEIMHSEYKWHERERATFFLYHNKLQTSYI